MVKIYEQQTAPTGGVNALQTTQAAQLNNPEAAAQINLGQSISNSASTFMDVHIANTNLALKQQESSAALWATNATSKAKLDWTQKFNQMQSDPTYSNSDGSTFSNAVMSKFKETQDKAIADAPDAASKKYVTEQFTQLGTSLGVQSIETAERQRITFNDNQLKSTMNNGASLVGIDPNQADAAYKNTDIAIEQANIPFEQKLALKEENRKSIVQAAANNQIQNNPAAFKGLIAPSVGTFAEGTPQSKIVNAAQASGNDPLVTLAIGQIESGLDFQAESSAPNSSAKGAFQFTDATWKRYGGTEADRFNPDKQIEIQQKLQADNANYLRAHIGREPSATDQYMAHFLGASGAAAALNADPNMKMSDLVQQYDPKNADAIINGNNIGDKTVGQVISSYNDKMNNAMQKFSNKQEATYKPFFMKIMTEAERQHYDNAATTAVNQQAATLRVNLSGQVADHEAQALNGIMPSQPLSQQQFNQMYPNNPMEASAAYTKYNDALTTGVKISQLSAMTADQRNATVAAATTLPEPNTPGYAEKVKVQQTLLAANDRINTQIKADPVSFVMQSSPVVKQYAAQMQANNTPENRKMYFDAIASQQQAQGQMFPKMMTKGQEDQTIAMMQNLQGNKKAEVVQQLVSQYGEHFPDVVRQLKANNAFPSGLTAILSAPTPQAMEQASIAADLDKKTLETTIGANKKNTDEAISDALVSYKGSLNQVQQGSKSTLDLQDTIEKIAYSYVAMGRDPADAAKTAVNMFVGDDKYQYVDNNTSGSTIRLPKSVNAKQIQSGLDNITDNLNIDNTSLNNVEALKNPWYMTDNADGYINQIKKNSMWLTTDDNKGASLFFMGKDNRPYPVFDKKGNHVYKSFTDLQIATPPVVDKNKVDQNYSPANELSSNFLFGKN